MRECVTTTQPPRPTQAGPFVAFTAMPGPLLREEKREEDREGDHVAIRGEISLNPAHELTVCVIGLCHGGGGCKPGDFVQTSGPS